MKRAALAFLLLTSCNSSTIAHDQQDVFGYADRESVPPKDTRSLLDTETPTTGERGGLRYAEWNEKRRYEGADEFKGFVCLDSCSGHRAGYEWAKARQINDDLDCSGNSWSFIEGCAAYALEREGPPEPIDNPRRELSLY